MSVHKLHHLDLGVAKPTVYLEGFHIGCHKGKSSVRVATLNSFTGMGMYISPFFDEFH